MAELNRHYGGSREKHYALEKRIVVASKILKKIKGLDDIMDEFPNPFCEEYPRNKRRQHSQGVSLSKNGDFQVGCFEDQS